MLTLSAGTVFAKDCAELNANVMQGVLDLGECDHADAPGWINQVVQFANSRPDITQLNLAGNHLSGTSLAAVAGLAYVDTLDLSYNSLNDEAVRAIAQNKVISDLSLMNDGLSAAGIAALAEAFGPAVMVYVELPASSDPTPLLEVIARHGLRAKLRTGGVTPDAFPTPAEVLRFLEACVTAGVACKATAGLHHPLRGEYPLTYAPDSPRATMHGFLNVFLTAAFLQAGVAAADVAPLLEERDPTAIHADADGIRWRDWRLTRDTLVTCRRTAAVSFGSCSFEEPVHEVATLPFG